MKLKKIESIDGKTVISVSSFFGLKTTQYVATRKITTDYWEWLSLPGMNLVPDCISFQLDAWKREIKIDGKTQEFEGGSEKVFTSTMG